MLKYKIVGKSTIIGNMVFCQFYVKERIWLFFWKVWKTRTTGCVVYYDSIEEANEAILNKQVKDKVVKCL